MKRSIIFPRLIFGQPHLCHKQQQKVSFGFGSKGFFWMQGKASVLGCEAVTSLTSNVKPQATVYFLADVVHRRKWISPFAALACDGEVGAWLCYAENWYHPAPRPSIALAF